MRAPPSDLLAIAAGVLARVRERRPRVHCITNAVAQAFTANVLLAAGAVPSMTIAVDEIAAFTASADGLLVNLGTFDAGRREAADIAIEVATRAGLPWVLDPVFVDRSRPRAAYARILIGRKPSAIRLNRAEFMAVAGSEPDATALDAYALDCLSVIGLTGAVDRVTDGARVVTIENGDPLMARVTAMGCAGSALLAACLSVESDPWLATVAALTVWGVAGEVAGLTASGPGTFVAGILDALFKLEPEAIRQRARVV